MLHSTILAFHPGCSTSLCSDYGFTRRKPILLHCQQQLELQLNLPTTVTSVLSALSFSCFTHIQCPTTDRPGERTEIAGLGSDETEVELAVISIQHLTPGLHTILPSGLMCALDKRGDEMKPWGPEEMMSTCPSPLWDLSGREEYNQLQFQEYPPGHVNPLSTPHGQLYQRLLKDQEGTVFTVSLQANIICQGSEHVICVIQEESQTEKGPGNQWHPAMAKAVG